MDQDLSRLGCWVNRSTVCALAAILLLVASPLALGSGWTLQRHSQTRCPDPVRTQDVYRFVPPKKDGAVIIPYLSSSTGFAGFVVQKVTRTATLIGCNDGTNLSDSLTYYELFTVSHQANGQVDGVDLVNWEPWETSYVFDAESIFVPYTAQNAALVLALYAYAGSPQFTQPGWSADTAGWLSSPPPGYGYIPVMDGAQQAKLFGLTPIGTGLAPSGTASPSVTGPNQAVYDWDNGFKGSSIDMGTRDVTLDVACCEPGYFFHTHKP